MKNLMRVILLVMLLAGAYVPTSAQQQLSDFQLETLKGKPFPISELLNDNQYKIMAVWDANCLPCFVQFNSFNERLKQMDDYNITLYAINKGDDAKKAKEVRDRFDWKFEILLDKQGVLYDYFEGDPALLPMTVILDEQLNIIYNEQGMKVWKYNEVGELYNDEAAAMEVMDFLINGEWEKMGTPVADYFEIIAKHRQW